MPSFEFTLLTILGCTLATWLSRVLPFVLLKKFDLPQPLLEYLSFVPIVIMSALWFSSLFTQNIGHLPQINLENALASVPTLLAAMLIGDRLDRYSFPFIDSLIINKKQELMANYCHALLFFIYNKKKIGVFLLIR